MPPAPPIDLGRLPAEPGVYRFWDADGRVLYIGRAVDLRRRVRSYFGSLKGRPRMRRMVPQIVRVDVAVCASEHEAAWLERNLLERSKPRWNRARGGLEVPVWIRIDDGPRAPGLTVSHEVVGDLPHFGPYLGGTRVREALTALGALYPLAYAADGLRGAEQAMAEARGVRPADRARLAAALSAVLGRDPAAVGAARTELAERRSRAASELEFEAAGRIQEQLGALEWLVSEQRVTIGEGRAHAAPTDGRRRPRRGKPDAVVAGWADGVLVEFGVVDGRVSTWVQRPCAEEAAAPLLAGSPGPLVAFATRNAAIAAELSVLHIGSGDLPPQRVVIERAAAPFHSPARLCSSGAAYASAASTVARS